MAQAYIDGFHLAINAPGQNLSSNAIIAMQNVFKPSRWRFQVAVDFLLSTLTPFPISMEITRGLTYLPRYGARVPIPESSLRVRGQLVRHLIQIQPPIQIRRRGTSICQSLGIKEVEWI